MLSLGENLAAVRERIAHSCSAVKRSPGEILIIAVTKGFPYSIAAEAMKCGLRDLGENRVQEMLQKKAMAPDSTRWHMIGRLQTNKVKHIAPFIHSIHSVDSIALFDEIQKHAAKNNRIIDVMIEVNVSGESQKGGVHPDETMRYAEHACSLTNVRVTGLMSVAADTEDVSMLHNQFASLRKLRESIAGAGIPNAPATELSMGMSNDFEIAIEEGATMVRLGTVLFGSRKQPVTTI